MLRIIIVDKRNATINIGIEKKVAIKVRQFIKMEITNISFT